MTVLTTSSSLPFRAYWDHFLARWGWKRMQHQVQPGLYTLGQPAPASPVFVSANYTLSFDALRSALKGMDAYILVLDTRGVNVWCAAGEGVFGTEELLHQIQAAHLDTLVERRCLILPQLSAPGISAHEVKKRSGFRVEYGPVRARDIPAYMINHQATPEMRRVTFGLWERALVMPIELVHTLLPTAAAAILLYFTLGLIPALGLAASVLAGAGLFPILLPWIPTRQFSSKGYILGGGVALGFFLWALAETPTPAWRQAINCLPYLLILPSLTAFLALNFTGSTTFTSRSGVKQEIYTYIPIMAWSGGAGLLLGIASAVLRWTGG